MPGPGNLFITGGSGFVGRSFLRRLAEDRTTGVTCLTRNEARLRTRVAVPAGWRVVSGDLVGTGWEAELPNGGTVLHMAATTGKARASEHYRVNLEGTERLLAAAETHDVARLVFVSSIAARFRNVRWYPYARSKSAAEARLARGSLDYVIVRPTQVLGPGSPVLEGLARLASAPLGIVFGGGRSRMQPIHVTDLVTVLLTCLREDAVVPPLVEVGGPETLTVLDLMKRLRLKLRGREGPWLHLPLHATQRLLRLLEPLLFPVLPLTSGQLASFDEENDGTADRHPLVEEHSSRMRGVESILNEWIGDV